MEVSVLRLSKSVHQDLMVPVQKYDKSDSGLHDFELPLDGVVGMKNNGE